MSSSRSSKRRASTGHSARPATADADSSSNQSSSSSSDSSKLNKRQRTSHSHRSTPPSRSIAIINEPDELAIEQEIDAELLAEEEQQEETVLVTATATATATAAASGKDEKQEDSSAMDGLHLNDLLRSSSREMDGDGDPHRSDSTTSTASTITAVSTSSRSTSLNNASPLSSSLLDDPNTSTSSSSSSSASLSLRSLSSSSSSRSSSASSRTATTSTSTSRDRGRGNNSPNTSSTSTSNSNSSSSSSSSGRGRGRGQGRGGSSSSRSSGVEKQRSSDFVHKYLESTLIVVDCRRCTASARIRNVREEGVRIMMNSILDTGLMPSSTVMVTRNNDAGVLVPDAEEEKRLLALLPDHFRPLYQVGQWSVVDGMHRITAVVRLFESGQVTTPFINAQLLRPDTPDQVKMAIAYAENRKTTRSVSMTLDDELTRIDRARECMRAEQDASSRSTLDKIADVVKYLSIQYSDAATKADNTTRIYVSIALGLCSEARELIRRDSQLNSAAPMFYYNMLYKNNGAIGKWPPAVQTAFLRRVMAWHQQHDTFTADGLVHRTQIPLTNTKAIFDLCGKIKVEVDRCDLEMVRLQKSLNVEQWHDGLQMRKAEVYEALWRGRPDLDEQVRTNAEAIQRRQGNCCTYLQEFLNLVRDEVEKHYSLSYEDHCAYESAVAQAREQSIPPPKAPARYYLSLQQLAAKQATLKAEQKKAELKKAAAEKQKQKEEIAAQRAEERKRRKEEKKKAAEEKKKKKQRLLEKQKKEEERLRAQREKKDKRAAAKAAAAALVDQEEAAKQQAQLEKEEKEEEEEENAAAAAAAAEGEEEEEEEAGDESPEGGDPERAEEEEESNDSENSESKDAEMAGDESEEAEGDNAGLHVEEGSEAEENGMGQASSDSNRRATSTSHSRSSSSSSSSPPPSAAEIQRALWTTESDSIYRFVTADVESWLRREEVRQQYGGKVDLVFADPPWNILEVDPRIKSGPILAEDQLLPTTVQAVAHGIKMMLTPTGHALICCAEQQLSMWRSALTAVQLHVEANSIVVIRHPESLHPQYKTSGLTNGVLYIVVAHASHRVTFNYKTNAVCVAPIHDMGRGWWNVLVNYRPPHSEMRLLKEHSKLNAQEREMRAGKNSNWMRLSEKHPSLWRTLFRRYAEPTVMATAAGAGPTRAASVLGQAGSGPTLVELFSGTGSGAYAALLAGDARYNYTGVEVDAQCQFEARARFLSHYCKQKEKEARSAHISFSQVSPSQQQEEEEGKEGKEEEEEEKEEEEKPFDEHESRLESEEPIVVPARHFLLMARKTATWKRMAFLLIKKGVLGRNWTVSWLWELKYWEEPKLLDEYIAKADYILVGNDMVDFDNVTTQYKYGKWHRELYDVVERHKKLDYIYPNRYLSDTIASKKYMLKLIDLKLTVPTIVLRLPRNCSLDGMQQILADSAGESARERKAINDLWTAFAFSQRVNELLVQEKEYLEAYHKRLPLKGTVNLHLKAGFSCSSSKAAHLVFKKVVCWSTVREGAAAVIQTLDATPHEHKRSTLQFLHQQYERVDFVMMQVHRDKYHECKIAVLEDELQFAGPEEKPVYGDSKQREAFRQLGKRVIEANTFGKEKPPLFWRLDGVYTPGDYSDLRVAEVEVCGAEYSAWSLPYMPTQVIRDAENDNPEDLPLHLYKGGTEFEALVNEMRTLCALEGEGKKAKVRMKRMWVVERVAAQVVLKMRELFGFPPVDEQAPTTITPPVPAAAAGTTSSSSSSSSSAMDAATQQFDHFDFGEEDEEEEEAKAAAESDAHSDELRNMSVLNQADDWVRTPSIPFGSRDESEICIHGSQQESEEEAEESARPMVGGSMEQQLSVTDHSDVEASFQQQLDPLSFSSQQTPFTPSALFNASQGLPMSQG